MAKNNVEAKAAAKAKKQKIILIVGGVLLLAVGAIQVPKLLGGGSSTEATPVAEQTTGAAGTPTTEAAAGTAATTAPSVAAASFKPAGSVAGVALPGVTAVRVSTGQLASFTLFEVKDPFVQQGLEEATSADTGSTTTTPAELVPKASGGSGAAPTAPAKEAAPPRIYATINLDGEPQQAKVKQQFPTSEPLFVLVSVGKGTAKIGIAGGSLDSGETVKLKLGKPVTLVNVTTNVRYVLKLVYTGSEPEAITSFSAETTDPQTGGAPAASSTVSVAPAATP